MQFTDDNLINEMIRLHDGLHYKIIRRISQEHRPKTGADRLPMSTVYLIECMDEAKQYALKIAPFEKKSALEREFSHLQDLVHPAIVKSADCMPSRVLSLNDLLLHCRIQEDHKVLVLEYYQQGSLDDLLRKRDPLSLDKIWHIVEQVGHALDYVHRQERVHLDLKPTNILINEEGQVFLSDFGVTRHYYQLRDIRNGKNGDSIVGTKSYSAPEKYDTETVPDFTVDIFSFGLIIYEMFTGQALLSSILRNHKKRGEKVINRMTMLEEAYQRVRESNIPRSIQSVILKAIAYDRNERYPSVGLLVTDMQQAFDQVDNLLPFLKYLAFAVPIVTINLSTYYLVCAETGVICYW